MEEEIDNVMRDRETISPSNLEYGMLVFIKRENEQLRYPQTKSKGPYIFLGYGNEKQTIAVIVNPKN